MTFFTRAIVIFSLFAASANTWAMRAPANELALDDKTADGHRIYCASSYENNSEIALKPINQLQIDGKVFAWSEWKERGTNASADQRLSYENVTDVFTTSERLRTLVHLSLDNGQTLSATDGHPFFTQDGWRDAIMLKKGGKLLLKGGDGDAAEHWAQITDIRTEQESVTTYNLEVANAHTFFVGADGVLVHNHGNSKSCDKLQYLYRIFDAGGNTKKFGVTGVAPNKYGLPRPNSQLKPGDKYEVVGTANNRAEILAKEREAVQDFKDLFGKPPPDNKFPRVK